MKTFVTSGNYFHSAKAVFLPLLWNCEVVSQPLNEWNQDRAKLMFFHNFWEILLCALRPLLYVAWCIDIVPPPITVFGNPTRDQQLSLNWPFCQAQPVVVLFFAPIGCCFLVGQKSFLSIHYHCFSAALYWYSVYSFLILNLVSVKKEHLRCSIVTGLAILCFVFSKNDVLANKAEPGQNKAKRACWLVSQRPIRRLTN